jgi:hypothetical protein
MVVVGKTLLRSVSSRFLSTAICLLCVVSVTQDAQAKKKKGGGGGISVDAGDYSDASVIVNKKTQHIQCLGNIPGKVSKGKFKSFSTLAKSAKGGKKKLYSTLAGKVGKQGCSKPDYLSLAKYTGPFTYDKARRLFDAFAFGASPQRVELAVQQGLEKTVNSLLTYQDEPAIEAVVQDLNCDGVLVGENGNKTCNPANVNDFSTSGVRHAQYYRALKSQNGAFEKLIAFLADERLATSTNALQSCDRHALLTYINDLRYAAITGDFREYVRRMNSSLLVHLEWLSGKSNKGSNPNEDYGREFLELLTVGATGIDGKPNYGDLDVAMSALAFSGNIVDDETINNQNVCFGAFASYLHASGPKKIFIGTPYEKTVFDGNDMVEAVFQHPATSESLARDLWKEYVNPFYTPVALKEFGKIIRDKNYNLKEALRVLMLSRAFHASASMGSLIKHPSDLIIGFLKTTGIPLDADDMTWLIGDEMGERFFFAPSVFGWDEFSLTSEAKVLEARNAITTITTQDSQNLSKKGYDFFDAFLVNMPGGGTDSDRLIDRLSLRFGVALNATQRQQLKTYLDFNIYPCNWNQNKCKNGQSYLNQGKYYIVNEPFSANKLFEDWEYKLRGALTIVAGLPAYRLK